jgi:membrane associated rhomboid family serine protease
MAPEYQPWRTVVRQQRPLLILIGLLTAVFVLQLLAGHAQAVQWMVVPQEITALPVRWAAGDFSIRPVATLLTSAFLHADLEHLIFNILFLWIFGALVAELLGTRWMVAIFIFSAVGGSLLHAVLNAGEAIPMLGASGAVMGFQGAYLGMALRWRLPAPHIWPMARPIPPAHLAALAVFGIVMDFMGLMDHERVGIAFGAHIGGFLVGLTLTSLVAGAPRTAGR